MEKPADEPQATVSSATPSRTVGVFDSGFGGLTVLRALLPKLPGTHFVYLGDTARLPYGAKSQATVARYAIESARFLVSQGADLLVIACNTATALALPEIRAAVSVPVIGVVEPGARAALVAADPGSRGSAHAQHTSNPVTAQHPSNPVTAQHPSNPVTAQHPSNPVISTGATQSRSGEICSFSARAEGTSLPGKPSAPPRILVLATAATVASHAYRDTCATLGLHATEMPCPLLVPLVEEGWTDHPVTREVLRIYLAEALTRTTPDAVVLGCTHYPLIAPQIRETLATLGSDAPVVDAAEATAEATRVLLHPALQTSPTQGTAEPATFVCYATDSVEKFARLGTHFLAQPIPEVHLLDLGG